MRQKTNNDQALEVTIRDPDIRRTVTKESFLYFLCFYLRHYIKYPLAEFHKEIIQIIEDSKNRLFCLVSFRGSAKSTLVTLGYSIWSILGRQEKKFVLIICQTQAQARLHMKNIRHELETNALLRNDLGPFQDEKLSEWTMPSIVFKNTGARITIASMDQSIRGMRHHEYRPDLIILDDIEDVASCKTKEGREKTYNWFTREVVPLGDLGTRIIMVGNLLHEDALMVRLKKRIEKKEADGLYRWYPLLNDEGVCLWPGKYTDAVLIDAERRKVANEAAWQQEYLLKIVSDENRPIHSDWIHFYEAPPMTPVTSIVVGVDLAISQSQSADYTSMVAIEIHGEGKDAIGYVLPNPINRRARFLEVVEAAKWLHEMLRINRPVPKFHVEENGFQALYVDALQEAGLLVAGVKNTSDKWSRLAYASYPMQSGKILFPKTGAEDLITQIVGFGIERHDDLSDAFSMAVAAAMEEMRKPVFRIFVG